MGFKQRTVLSGNTYGYGSLDYLRDDIAEIDYRFIVGLGMGQYLMQDDANTLGVEAGLAYVFEELLESDQLSAQQAVDQLCIAKAAIEQALTFIAKKML